MTGAGISRKEELLRTITFVSSTSTNIGLLMFPWPAGRRAIRTHGILSIVSYVLVLSRILVITR